MGVEIPLKKDINRCEKGALMECKIVKENIVKNS